ncbi:hypothetical protein B9Z19DRAFT_822952 [Tuber borchii]|uniref:DRBM domain-containing protein n=1 Tax=Tuber borchii TaxID=42251 RepID=A0A2T7A7B3_TUBBO|nr:hypothetical protein B9Z19DRAFT_822952 [Tuber borchii]
MISQKTPSSTTAGDISIMSSPTSPGFSSSATYNYITPPMCTKWQDRLIAYCKEHHLSEPLFQDFSDRRGGRTAWTTMVTIGSRVPEPLRIWAKFSYEVTYVNNAREDAAECALQHLQGNHPLGCACGSS